MNKIYRVIWNANLRMFQVVSELTKSKGKTKSNCKAKAFSAYTLGVLYALGSAVALGADSDTDIATLKSQVSALQEQVNALKNSKVHYVSLKGTNTDTDSNVNNDGAQGDNAIAIGVKAKSKDYGVSLGAKANVAKAAGVAIGYDTEAGEQGIALGVLAKATGKLNSLAIGLSANASNEGSQAVGQLANASGEHAMAYGDRAEAHDLNDLAFGSSTSVTGENSAAFGSFAYVGKQNTTNPDSSAHTLFNTKGGREYSVIHPTEKMRYSYSLALGALAKAFGHQDVAILGEAHDHIATVIGSSAIGKGNFATAVGARAHTNGKYATALGYYSEANKQGATVLGHNAKATVESAVALGEESVSGRLLTDQKSIGYDPNAKSVVYNKGNSVYEVVLSAEDKAKYKQLTEELKTLNQEATQLEKEYHAIVDEKNQPNLTQEQLTEIEGRLTQKSTELDEKLTMIQEKSTIQRKLVSKWQATAGAVSVGNEEKGITRQIMNVAAGNEDTDAVNVAQLKALRSALYIGVGEKPTTEYLSTKKILDLRGTSAPANDNANGEGAAPNSLDHHNYGTLTFGHGAFGSHGFATAIGANSRAVDRSVAVGAGSSATSQGVALGVNAVSELRGTALGFNTQANSDAIAIGTNATAGYFYQHDQGHSLLSATGIAIGANSLARLGVSLGNGAKSDAYGVSLGNDAYVKYNGVALGNYAKVYSSGGLALGTNAIAERNEGEIGYLPNTAAQPTTEKALATLLGEEEAAQFATTWATQIDEYNAVMKKFYDASHADDANNLVLLEKKGLTDTESQEAYQTALGKVKELENAYLAVTNERYKWEAKNVDFLNALARKNAALSAFKANQGAVSVGAPGYTGKSTGKVYAPETRQIIHLAAGSEDTDAVNVAQLKALRQLGLNIAGNDYDKTQESTKDKVMNSPLGSVLSIQGQANALYGSRGFEAEKYASNNLISFNDSGVLRFALRKTPSFTGIDLGEGEHNVSLTVGEKGVLKANEKPILTEENFKTFFK